MDSKQLKQEAEEKAKKRVNGFKCQENCEKSYVMGVLDFAEPRERKIAELERENTELREKLRPENCLKLLAKEGYIKFTSDQLTNAKDLLKWFVWYFREGSPNLVPYKHKVEEAEQFISEAEK